MTETITKMYRGNKDTVVEIEVDRPRKVCFDFDHTLSELAVQHLAYRLIGLGIEVWVCTARHSDGNKVVEDWGNEDLYQVTDTLGIPRDRIIFCNYEDKKPYLEAEGFVWHLDDDFMVVRSLRHSFVKGVHVLNRGWMDKCIKLLNLYEMNNVYFEERMKIINDTHPGFEHVDSLEVSQNFNIVEVMVVVKDKATSKFYASNIFQDINPDNTKDFSEINTPEAPVFREVFPKSITTIVYE